MSNAMGWSCGTDIVDRNPLNFGLRILHNEDCFEILMIDGLCRGRLVLGGGGGRVVF